MHASQAAQADNVQEDAAIAALHTKQPAPSGAMEEVENLRKALVYAAFALHDTPRYMLAQGITLIDGDTVRVSRDGWTVEASVNPHRQPAPATQQPGDVVAYLDVGAGGYLDFGSELSEDALQQLPKGRHALVIAGTYGIDGYVAAPQPSPTTQAGEPFGYFHQLLNHEGKGNGV